MQKGNVIQGTSINDNLGRSTAINAAGDIVAVGTNAYEANYVRVFQWSGSAWVQMGADIIDVDALSYDVFGFYVDLDATGLVVAIGATESASSRGHAAVFEFASGVTFSV